MLSRRVVLGIALGLLIGFAAPADAQAKGAAKKKHSHSVHGQIVSVNASSITIKTHHHAKKGKAAKPDTEKTYQLSNLTKVAKLVKTGKGKKGVTQQMPASFADLHTGEHVAIKTGGKKSAVAQTVDILQQFKKAKKKKNA